MADPFSSRGRAMSTSGGDRQQSRNYRGTGIGGVEGIGTVREVAFLLADERRRASGGGSLHEKRSGCQRATERCQPSARRRVQPVLGGLREPRLSQR